MSDTKIDSHHSVHDLVLYAYRELAPKDMDRVGRHVDNCGSCSRELAELEETRGAFEHMAIESVDDATWDRIVRRAVAASSWGRPTITALPHVARLAAAALIVVGAAVGLRALTRKSDSELRMPAASAVQRLIVVGAAAGSQNENSATVAMFIRSIQHDPSPNVRLAAIDALSSSPPNAQAGKDVLDALAHEPSPPLRLAMIDLALHFDRQGARQSLQVVARNDSDAAVRASAMAASGGAAQ